MSEKLEQYAHTCRIGLLTQAGYPLLPFWIDRILRKGVGPLFIITDISEFSEKNAKLLEERTNGYFTQNVAKFASQFSSHRRLSIPDYLTENHNSLHCLSLVKDLDLEMLVNCGTPRKLKHPILNSVCRGVLNVHPGLLPKYRGASAVEWSLYNGDEIGNTAHFMDGRYDGGNIICQQKLDLSNLHSYTAIRTAVYKQSFRLMADAIEKILKLDLTSEDGCKQNENDAFEWKPIGETEMETVKQKFNSRKFSRVWKSWDLCSRCWCHQPNHSSLEKISAKKYVCIRIRPSKRNLV